MKRFAAAMAGVLCFSGGSLAQKDMVGDWTVDIGGGQFTEAYTGNESGSTFALYCTRDSCIFYLDTRTQCRSGAKIPMLINSESGSAYVASTCVRLNVGRTVRYVSSIRDADVITAISSGKLIGFAIPLKGGEFKVIRFSLEGATIATQRVVAGVKAPPRFKDAGLRDRIM